MKIELLSMQFLILGLASLDISMDAESIWSESTLLPMQPVISKK